MKKPLLLLAISLLTNEILFAQNTSKKENSDSGNSTKSILLSEIKNPLKVKVESTVLPSSTKKSKSLFSNATIFDAQLLSAKAPSEYSMIPISQSVALPFEGTIKNNGSNDLNNITLGVNVKVGQDNIGTYTYTPALTTLIPNQEVTLGPFSTFTPMSLGIFQFKFFPSMNEIDNENANDTLTAREVEITSNIYARFSGNTANAIGIGEGVEAFLGTLFTINNAVDLSKVLVSFNEILPDTPVTTKVRIVGTTDGIPDASIPIWESNTILYSENIATEVAFIGNPLTLAAGTYCFGIVEIDNAVQIFTYNNIFTPNTNFVRWATSPFGDVFTPLENFGLNQTFHIKPVFKCSENIAQTADITTGFIDKIASETITATNIISNAKVTYVAGKSITLNPGFKVEGERFKAQIEGCDN